MANPSARAAIGNTAVLSKTNVLGSHAAATASKKSTLASDSDPRAARADASASRPVKAVTSWPSPPSPPSIESLAPSFRNDGPRAMNTARISGASLSKPCAPRCPRGGAKRSHARRVLGAPIALVRVLSGLAARLVGVRGGVRAAERPADVRGDHDRAHAPVPAVREPRGHRVARPGAHVGMARAYPRARGTPRRSADPRADPRDPPASILRHRPRSRDGAWFRSRSR